MYDEGAGSFGFQVVNGAGYEIAVKVFFLREIDESGFHGTVTEGDITDDVIEAVFPVS
jgi:hypothetical protein